jgi:hypothetical protein
MLPQCQTAHFHDAFTDEDVVLDEQGPLVFIQKDNGPARGLAHIHLEWDEALHATVGTTACVNGGSFSSGVWIGPYCPPVGHIRHLGSMFDSTNDPEGGLPVTANPDITGLAGGYGWLLDLDGGAPHTLQISQIEVMPDTPLILSIAYPPGTSFTIKANALWCGESCTKSCEELFTQVTTVEDVRKSAGNVYHFDTTTGLLTIRVIMFPERFTGEPYWKLYDFDDVSKENGEYALKRFERDGVILPIRSNSNQRIEIVADCARDDAYCADAPPSSNDYDDVCSVGLEQVSYDRCCEVGSASDCEYVHSSTSPPTAAPTLETVVPNIIENGDFERYGICPWFRFGSSTTQVELETSDVVQGSGAVLVSQRTQVYDGLAQELTDRFEYDVTYSFKSHVKILSDEVTNKLKVTLRVTYDKPSSKHQYLTVFWSSSFPTDTWMAIDTTYTLTSTELQDYPVVGLLLYFETVDHTFDFLVDEVSMEPEIIT